MKTRILIFLSLCYANIAYSQLNNLKEYYVNVNKAELAIVDSNFANASAYYQEAFRYKKYPFSQDLYNAALISILTKSYAQTLNYLEYLFKLGFKITALDTIPFCKDFLTSPFGKKARQKNKVAKFAYNTKYKQAIDKLLYDDQYFRMKPDGYKTYGDTIRKIDKKNVEKLLSLIAKYGFPSEEKTGIDEMSMTKPTFWVLIFHQNTGARYQTHNYSPILKSAVLKGELRNNIGATLIQGADGIIYYDAFGIAKAKFDTTIIILDNMGNTSKIDTTFATEWGYFKLSPTETAKINSKREEIYLELMEENLKKIKFSLRNNYFLFNANTNKSIFNCSDYKDFLHMKNNLIYP